MKKTPIAHSPWRKAREAWWNRGRSVTDRWDQKYQWDAVFKGDTYDLLFGIAVSQFRLDGQSVRFWDLVSLGHIIFGSYPSEVVTFGS
jgi:hypothetical protein